MTDAPWKTPIDGWTQGYFETQVLMLASEESDRIEFKSSALFEWSKQRTEDHLRKELATYVSAFSNYDGGLVVFGVAKQRGSADKGPTIDGGVPQTVKGRQSGKEWLEDVIPWLVEPTYRDFTVHSFGRPQGWEKVAEDRQLIVVDLRGSSLAPHQSVPDRRYYGRFGSKTHPLPHRFIEDIRSRIVQPHVDCEFFIPANIGSRTGPFKLVVRMTNLGATLASHVAYLVWLPASIKPVWADGTTSAYVVVEDLPVDLTGQRQYVRLEKRGRPFPLLPGLPEEDRISIGVGLDQIEALDELQRLPLRWEVYADNAPPRRGRTTLGEVLKKWRNPT